MQDKSFKQPPFLTQLLSFYLISVLQLLEKIYGSYLASPEAGHSVTLIYDLTNVPKDYAKIASEVQY